MPTQPVGDFPTPPHPDYSKGQGGIRWVCGDCRSQGMGSMADHLESPEHQQMVPPDMFPLHGGGFTPDFTLIRGIKLADMGTEPPSELIETLAALAHDCWADWMAHQQAVDDDLHRKAWSRQMKTPYADLSEDEKQSDRDVVLKYQKPALDEIQTLKACLLQMQNAAMDLTEQVDRLKGDAKEAAAVLGSITGTHPEYCEVVSQAQVAKQCLEIADERRLTLQANLKSAKLDFDEACLEASVAIKRNVAQAAQLKLAQEALEKIVAADEGAVQELKEMGLASTVDPSLTNLAREALAALKGEATGG